MEFGLSSASLNSNTPVVRVAFWDNFKSKKESLENKNFSMTYVFGEIERNDTISRRVDYSIDFNQLKVKKLFSNTKFSPVEIDSSLVLSFVNRLPSKIRSQIDSPVKALSTESFTYREELFHLVLTNNKKYGVLYDNSLKVVGVVLNGKISTSPYDIF